jgi:membrane-associated PAP2 superfamily phosphatase
MGESQRFYLTHLGSAALLIVAALWLGHASDWDFRLARLAFDPGAGIFPLGDHWFVEGVMHGYGKRVGRTLTALLVLMFAASWWWRPLRPWRLQLLYLVLAMATGPSLVGDLKHLSNVYCPSQLHQFGGGHPFQQPFAVAAGADSGSCWPAGHASYGFALLPLYFALRDRAPRQAGIALVVAITWGNLLGLGRVLQGAHFPSHQLWSWTICWLAALIWYVALLRRDLLPLPRRRPAAPAALPG